MTYTLDEKKAKKKKLMISNQEREKIESNISVPGLLCDQVPSRNYLVLCLYEETPLNAYIPLC